MPRRRGGRPASRRVVLETGLAAAAAAALGMGVTARSAEAGDAGSFQAYDKVAAENYPWGWIRWLLNGQIDPNAEMTVGLVHMEPNQVNTRHVHPNSVEVLHVISGRLEHLLDGRWVALKAGDTIRIPRGMPHQGRTGGEGSLVLVAYDTPRRVMVPAPEAKKG